MQSELPPSTDSTPGEPSAPVEPKGVWARFSRAQKIVASIGLVILMLPILGSSVLVAFHGLKDPYAFGQGIGKMAIFTLVILGIFYAIAKAKSKRAAWASVVGLLLMSSCFGGIVLSGFAAMERQRADRSLATSLGKALEPAIDAAQSQLDSPGLNPQRVRTDAEKTIGALNNAMKDQDPALAECVRISSDQMRTLAESFATYQESFAPFIASGGMSAASLTEPGAAKQRRAMLEAPRNRLGLTRQALSSFIPTIETQLLRSDVPRSTVTEFMTGLTADPTLPLRAKELDIDVKILETMDEYISILERHHGNWTVSDGRNVTFKRAVSEADVSRFNALGREMRTLAEEQNRLKAEVVAHLKAKASNPLK